MLAIPESEMSLCEALTELSRGTWRELAASNKCRQPLHEESITSFNLMRLALAVPGIIVERHTNRQEAKSGADWEWWVGRPGSFVGFRLQAKILDPKSLQYKLLYHRKKDALKQVNKLIASAENGPRRTFPLFTFYNYWADGANRSSRQTECQLARDAFEFLGWTAISAYELRRRLEIEPTKKLADFEDATYPTSCLYCCNCTPGYDLAPSDQSLPHRVAEWASSMWGAVERADRQENVVVHETAPAYVERMYKGETADQGWTREPTPPARKIPKGLSRVLLIRAV